MLKGLGKLGCFFGLAGCTAGAARDLKYVTGTINEFGQTVGNAASESGKKAYTDSLLNLWTFDSVDKFKVSNENKPDLIIVGIVVLIAIIIIVWLLA